MVLSAQVCRLSVAGLNRSRRVSGPVHAECPGTIIHSAPFGNWGATSNFGTKQNGHQFDGWCHDTRICDNSGDCISNCRDGWYEWNSCTDVDRYKPPNCTLYNANDCTGQVTTTGINVHGTRVVEVPVACPSDSDGNGVPDRGGCRELSTYSPGTNFLSLYELDPGTPDELVQTVYFPPTPVPLTCDVWGCGPAGSNWVTPSGYDSPTSPPIVFAEMAAVVNWGALLDPGGRCRITASTANSVSAASFVGPGVAPDSIATIFGDGLAPVTASAGTIPLPESLGSTMVRITDRTGAQRFAPLFYVSPGQVNLLIPAGTAVGPASLSVFRGEAERATGTLQLEATAPGLFAANANGRGVAAAIVVRVGADGSQTSEPAFACGAATGSCVSAPIDLGPAADRLFLVLFGTGIRGRSALSAVTVTLGGQAVEVLYAGAQGQFVGLDQINLSLPRTLAGRGEVDVVVTVDGRRANLVSIQVR